MTSGETWHAEDIRQFAERSGLKFLDRWRKWAGVGGVSLVESQRTEKPTPSEVALVLGYMRGQEAKIEGLDGELKALGELKE